ncbi:hypothetical protein OROMI_009211 [Orobanche minor]
MKNIRSTSARVCSRIWKYIKSIKVEGKTRSDFWKSVESITHPLDINVAARIGRKVSWVLWLKPPTGWFKLNTDGAVKGNPGPANAGGIVRGHDGAVVFCFWEYIGVQTNTFAELHRIWRGLQLCRDRGLDNNMGRSGFLYCY